MEFRLRRGRSSQASKGTGIKNPTKQKMANACGLTSYTIRRVHGRRKRNQYRNGSRQRAQWDSDASRLRASSRSAAARAESPRRSYATALAWSG